MSLDDQVELGQVRIRWDDLDDASTTFERSIAAPSDETIRVMWLGLTFVGLIDSLFVAIVFFGIMSSKKVRNSPFNMYLLFLMFPDFIYGFFCFVTCIMNYVKGEYWGPGMCYWQAMYLVFGTAANAWLNVVVTYEVYRLLSSSNIRKKYFPPTRKTVVRNSLCCYALAFFLSTLVLMDGLPHGIDAQVGFVCLPVAETTSETVFFYAVFMPVYTLIPASYISWCFYDIVFRSKLLPPKGKRRELAIYFFRIVFLFAFFWFPVIGFWYLAAGQASPWVSWAVGVLGHLHGLANAAVSLMKKDVYWATKRLITCKCLTVAKQDEGIMPRPKSSLPRPETEASLAETADSQYEEDDQDPDCRDDDFVFVQDESFQFGGETPTEECVEELEPIPEEAEESDV
jgi:hypothetical protein